MSGPCPPLLSSPHSQPVRPFPERNCAPLVWVPAALCMEPQVLVALGLLPEAEVLAWVLRLCVTVSLVCATWWHLCLQL